MMNSKHLALASFLLILGYTKIHSMDKKQFIFYIAQLAELEYRLDKFNDNPSPRNKQDVHSMFPKSPTAQVKRIKGEKERKR
jgi:hypothetical protein